MSYLNVHSTPQRKQPVTIKNSNLLPLFKEIIVVYSKNPTEVTYKLRKRRRVVDC
jgi:hypothetical protein